MDFKVGRSKATVDNETPAALATDSVLITRDSILQWKLEGRVFYAQQGDAGTKLDFAETAYDEDQPQFAITVPQGTICIPMSLSITLEDVPQTENHIIWSTTTNDIGAGTSTAITPVNYRRDGLYSPACKAYSLYTGDATAATGLVEVKRWYHPFASAAVTDGTDLHHHVWTVNDPSMPILIGPATIQMHVYSGTDGPQGFGEYTWVELPASELGL
jgi:hypothetical protein